MAHDDYEIRRERQRQGVALAKAAGRHAGRKTDEATHARIIALRSAGQTIKKTTELAGCSPAQVKRIWAMRRTEDGQGLTGLGISGFLCDLYYRT